MNDKMFKSKVSQGYMIEYTVLAQLPSILLTISVLAQEGHRHKKSTPCFFCTGKHGIFF